METTIGFRGLGLRVCYLGLKVSGVVMKGVPFKEAYIDLGFRV